MSYVYALVMTVGAYALLGLLLLSLNLASLWSWWVKAAVIVLTTGMFAGSFFAISGLLGWPAIQAPPPRFSLIGSRVIEPDKAGDLPGEVYLWLEAVDENNLPISAPRSYQVAYSTEMAEKVREAQEILEGGKPVLGEIIKAKEAPPPEEEDPESGNEAGDGERPAGRTNLQGTGTGTGSSIFLLDIAGTLLLTDMPPPELPGKDQ